MQLESQARQILSLEAAIPPPESIEGSEAELRKMLAAEIAKREEKERWADELVRELDKEKKVCSSLFSGSHALNIRYLVARQVGRRAASSCFLCQHG